MQPDETFDVVIAGSGAAGLAAAVTAAEHGLKVLVLEKAAQFGGTTAWSGGWLWVPRNPLAVAAGIVEEKETIRTYLRALIGNRYDTAKIEAFLEAAPEMVRFFHEETAVRFRDGNAVPDMHGHLPGAGTGGRSVTALPFDGRELGPELARLRPPKPEISFLGMGIASGADLNHFLNMTRSVRSFLHVGRRVTKHLLDLVTHRRGLLSGQRQRAGGAAGAGGLRPGGGRSAPRCPGAGADPRRERVAGVETEGGRVLARAGVVLAAGGFPNDPARRRALFPHAPTGAEHWTAAPPENTGDGLRLGAAAGGALDADLAHPAAWAPVSLVPKRDGSKGHFPHLIERAKPGVIAVRADGRRFTNEADGYHDFIADLLAATPAGERPVCWLVCDHAFLRRYGLGYAKPAPLPLWPELRSGYLKRGDAGRAGADLRDRSGGAGGGGGALQRRRGGGRRSGVRQGRHALQPGAGRRRAGPIPATRRSARGPTMRSRWCRAASAPSLG
jgi:hypothetical protein